MNNDVIGKPGEKESDRERVKLAGYTSSLNLLYTLTSNDEVIGTKLVANVSFCGFHHD